MPKKAEQKLSPQPVTPSKPMPEKKNSTSVKSLDETSWIEVVNLIKAKYNTLYGVVRMGIPDFSQPGVIALEFAFAFHQKRINEQKNRSLILQAVKQISGEDMILECKINPKLLNQKVSSEEANEIDAINSIFGEAELL